MYARGFRFGREVRIIRRDVSGVTMTKWFARLALVAIAVTCAAPARADDPHLAHIRAMLAPMRAGVVTDKDLRGATPALMGVKHALRDWLEGRLSEFPADGDAHVFAAGLNQELRAADLFCVSVAAPATDRCAARDPAALDMTGFVEPVYLERQEDLLFVVTRIGIYCGDDDSAYAYERRGNRWQRIWAYEQEIAPGVAYRPQYISGIRVSWPDQVTHERTLMLLGHATWCTSNWLPVYDRIWRLHPDGAAKLLVDESHTAFFAKDPPIEGSVSNDDAVVEFRAGSLDVADVQSYEAVRHYRIDHDTARQIAPVALGPRGFVEEWLRAAWTTAAAWGAPAGDLQSWHARLQPVAKKFGSYIEDDTQHCRKDAELWQVGVAFSEPTQDVYFIVRWRRPYRFELMAVRAAPRADCDEPDAGADADRTLFQDWR